MKLEITGVEYVSALVGVLQFLKDTPEDTVENCGEKTMLSPMCRTSIESNFKLKRGPLATPSSATWTMIYGCPSARV